MKLPVIFVGHGSPMNAIEDNEYSRTWAKIGRNIQPKSILMISAHWFTRGTLVQDEENPRIINDMYGFPEELYHVGYQVKGDRALTQSVLDTLGDDVSVNNEWGLDHGAWSVLHHMYPKRDIPVAQLSVNRTLTPEAHFKIGQKLAFLREQDVLIIASGNIVHNLRMVRFDMAGGHPDCVKFDAYIKDSILNKDFDAVINYRDLGDVARLSVPTDDHFDPLLYALGAASKDDTVEVFNESVMMGTMSMTGYIFK